MGDRFYAQQCAYFKVKPADMIHMGLYPDHPDALKLRAKMERKSKLSIGGGKEASRISAAKRLTKADVLEQIQELMGARKHNCTGFKDLTMDDMLKVKHTVSELADIPEMEMPTGRIKAPYVEALELAIPSGADYKKMKVTDLRDVLRYLGVR